MAAESSNGTSSESASSESTSASSESAAPSIGAMIVAAREKAGLSLADVSERTRIRKGVIDAIEHDDFSHCGGDVYAKGHLRSIGTAVSADAAAWVAAYNDQYGTPAPTATEMFDSEATRPVRIRRGVNWSAIMAAALVIAVGLVVVQMTTASNEPSREQVTVAEPEATPTETAPTDEPTDDTKVAQADQDEVVVRVTALPGQRSWMLVTSLDGTALFEGEIFDGQSKTFRDRDKLSVLSGCASAVELTVNGQDTGSPGATCSPVTARFTPKDPVGAAG